MGWSGVFYRLVGRRFSTSLVAASVGVFGLDLLVNRLPDAYWDNINKGKQWKDVKPIAEARFAEAKEQARLEAAEAAESNMKHRDPEPQNRTPLTEASDDE
ncbi:Complex III subunit 9 [Aphelenchoides besseyi]|nr:Complex III subunit 9 [Aphelenchoides besseyi]KAI6208784.1 Complex III subunit 9 [Aphelenchoides besseyi]